MLFENFASAVLQPGSTTPYGVKGNTPKRFAVYRNNVVVGLIRAMEANFPVVVRLLGRDYFTGLAREFVLHNPPQSPLMFEYGQAFPAYLGVQDDLRHYAYLADIAKLEIAMRQSYHAADAPILMPEILAAVDPEVLSEIRFIPHPAMRLLTSNFAIVSIAKANNSDQNLEVPDPLQPEWALLARPEFDVVLTSLTKSHFAFVQSLALGKSLGEAADSAYDIDNDFDLASILGLVLLHGVFTSIE
jgi:Putative DNA-binding domain